MYYIRNVKDLKKMILKHQKESNPNYKKRKIKIE
jgi:hypothetical protein